MRAVGSRPVLAALAVAALAGCGSERIDAPDLDQPVISGDAVERAYPDAGLFFEAPASLSFGRGPAPLVVQTASGSATIAIWRYERTEPLPRETAQLDAAEDALASTARQRDQTFREISRRQTKVDGAPAIVLVGDERIAGQPRRVRSTHVFAKGAEYVVDQYAAPDDFEALDGAVFEPLVRSVRIDPPRK
jgi:hypothetical protein